jgi:hypothetical protein
MRFLLCDKVAHGTRPFWIFIQNLNPSITIFIHVTRIFIHEAIPGPGGPAGESVTEPCEPAGMPEFP